MHARTLVIVYNNQDSVQKFSVRSQRTYVLISAHFGIGSVENLVSNLRNRFIKRYGETETIIYVKCCADWFVCLGVFLFIAFFNFFLLNLFIYVVLGYHIRW